jgi:hypothetical protein
MLNSSPFLNKPSLNFTILSCGEVKNEWRYISTLPIRVCGVGGDNSAFHSFNFVREVKVVLSLVMKTHGGA